MTNLRSERLKVETIKLDGLRPVGRRPSLATYLRTLWQRRHFIIADSKARVTSSTRQLVLGSAWLVLKPLLDAAVYLLIFGLLLKTDRGIDNFIGYLTIGVFMFGFTARSLNGGAASVAAGRNLIRAFTFPRVSLPISAVLRETLNAVPGMATMLILVAIVPPHAEITWRWLLFPVIFSMQVAFNLGIAMLAARLVAKIRDVTNLISFFTRFWLYGSAVFFSYDQFIEHPTVLKIMQANPMFQVLDISRDLLLYGQTPELRSWAIVAAWTAAVLTLGFLTFWRGEDSYGKE